MLISIYMEWNGGGDTMSKHTLLSRTPSSNQIERPVNINE